MDILRKELNAVYAAQCLDKEFLDRSGVEECKGKVESMVSVNNACSVITDAARDCCYLYAGGLGFLLGLTEGMNMYRELDSSDEDLIYDRLHPEDLAEKRMLEYEFFRYVDPLPAAEKVRYRATCRIRIRDRRGRYVMVDNSVQILRPSPAGRIWLILCCYDLSSGQEPQGGIEPRIVNNSTGDVLTLSLADRRDRILTKREKDVLRLIRDGRLSKQIADELGISIHTVNRHRQNILEKLSVGNSVEAIVAATSMKLF